MNDTDQIKEALKTFAEKYGPAALIPAIVTAINTNDTIAVKLSDDVLIDDVRLKSVVKTGTKFIVKPALNSNVLIGRIENSEEFILVSADEIDEVRIEINTITLVMDTNGIVMNGGALHGLVTRDGTKDQLNKLEQDVNDLKNVFSTWIPVANDGGAALKTHAATWYGSALVQTVDADIENTNIKQ